MATQQKLKKANTEMLQQLDEKYAKEVLETSPGKCLTKRGISVNGILGSKLKQ